MQTALPLADYPVPFSGKAHQAGDGRARSIRLHIEHRGGQDSPARRPAALVASGWRGFWTRRDGSSSSSLSSARVAIRPALCSSSTWTMRFAPGADHAVQSNEYPRHHQADLSGDRGLRDAPRQVSRVAQTEPGDRLKGVRSCRLPCPAAPAWGRWPRSPAGRPPPRFSIRGSSLRIASSSLCCRVLPRPGPVALVYESGPGQGDWRYLRLPVPNLAPDLPAHPAEIPDTLQCQQQAGQIQGQSNIADVLALSNAFLEVGGLD